MPAHTSIPSPAQVSRKNIKEVVLKIYAERRNIAASLRDTDSIVNTLETGVGVLVHFIFFAVYLLIFGVDVLQVMVGAWGRRTSGGGVW